MRSRSTISSRRPTGMAGRARQSDSWMTTLLSVGRSMRLACEIEPITFDGQVRGGLEVELGGARKAHALVHAHGYPHHVGRVQRQYPRSGSPRSFDTLPDERGPNP